MTPGPRRRPSAATFLLVAALGLAVWLPLARFDELRQDDAYISYIYARNFAEGNGLVYNVGEPAVEGYTNFLWTLALGWGMRSGLDPEALAPVLGLLATLGAVLLTYVAARRLGATNGFAAGAALLFALRPTLTAHSMGGLETPLFALLVLAGLVPHFGRRPGLRGGLLASLALAGATLTRPEGLLVFFLVEAYRLAGDLGEHRRVSAYLRQALPRWVPFVLLVGVHVLWRRATYGDWLPNTFYAKVAPGLEVWRVGLRYVLSAVVSFGGFLVLLPYLIYRRWSRRPGAGLALLISSTFLVYVVYIGGDYLPGFRHLLVVMPLWCVLAAASFSELVERPFGEGRRRSLGLAFVLVAALGLTYEYDHAGYWKQQDRRHELLVAAGKKLDELLPPEAWIAVTAAGRVPYFARRRTIDMMGLNDAHIARRRVGSYNPELAGHLKGDGGYVLDRRPDVILLLHSMVSEQALSRADPSAARRGFGISEHEILDDSRFGRDYRLWSVPLPEVAAYVNFFARRSLFGPRPPTGLIPAESDAKRN